MAARFLTLPSSTPVDGSGALRPEWRILLGRITGSLNAAAAIAALDSVTTYSADDLRDKIIELQTALGAEA